MSTAPNVKKVKNTEGPGATGGWKGVALPENLGDVRPTSQNPHPTKDQTLRFS